MFDPLGFDRWLRNAKEEQGAQQARGEIENEIADHLACAADDLRQQTLDSRQAAELAQQRFGNVSAIIRRCLWIRLGDQVMLRYAVTGLLACVMLALLVFSYAMWRSARLTRLQLMAVNRQQMAAQEQLRLELGTLSSKLGRLVDAETSRRPATISGQLYLGDPEHPAAGATLELRRLPEGNVHRRLRADETGRFSTENLTEGEYYLLAPLVGEGNSEVNGRQIKEPMFQIQSAPLYVASGGNDITCNLDVRLQSSSFYFELDRQIPPWVLDEADGLVWTCSLHFHPQTLINLPWNPSQELPQSWPARGAISDNLFRLFTGSSINASEFYPGISTEQLSKQFRGFAVYPVDTWQIIALLRPAPSSMWTVAGRPHVGPGRGTTGIDPDAPKPNSLGQRLTKVMGFGGAAPPTAAQSTEGSQPAEASQPAIPAWPTEFNGLTSTGPPMRFRLHIPPGYEEQVVATLRKPDLSDEELLRACKGVRLGIELLNDTAPSGNDN